MSTQIFVRRSIYVHALSLISVHAVIMEIHFVMYMLYFNFIFIHFFGLIILSNLLLEWKMIAINTK